MINAKIKSLLTYLTTPLIILSMLLFIPKTAANINQTKKEINQAIEAYYNQTFIGGDLPEISVTAPLTFSKKIYLIAQLISSEAANEPMLGKIAIVNVLRTRARVKGKTIKQIIYQRDRRGNPQFDGIDTNRFKQKPSKECIIAAKRGMKEWVIPKSVYFFHNPIISTDSMWVNYIEQWTYKDIGRHRFCHSPKLLTEKEKENLII